MGRMDGKVAFVTGAARGQGRSHAVRLAQEGADIIAVDICRKFEASPAPGATPEDLDITAGLVKDAGARVVTAEVDVRDYDALRAAVDSGVEQLGRLDVIVANAGIGTMGAKLHKIDEALWQEMIDVNLSGVWKSVKAGVPHLLAGNRGGSIVLTSSVAGFKAYLHTGHYVAGQAWRDRPDAFVRRRIGAAHDQGQCRAAHARELAAADERGHLSCVSA